MIQDNKLPQYHFNWRGALSLFGGLFAATILISLLSVAVLLITHDNLQYSQVFLVISNALIFVSAIFAFDYFACRPQTGKKLNFNFSTTNLKTYFLIFPMMLGMMFISEFITNQIPTTGPVFGELYELFSKMMEQMTSDAITMVILAVVMAPIFEEIIFRGIIQKGLMNKGVNPTKSIWIASICFGLIHGNPWQFVGAVLLGYVLGVVYYKTKSLLLPMLLHGFNNLVSTILVTLFKTESFAETFHIPEWSVLAIGIVLFGVFYYFFMYRNKMIYYEP